MSEWFLDVDGTRTGPFTLDQIQGFLADGEIRPEHRVTAEKLQGAWITVRQLLQGEIPPMPHLPARSIPFQPPPRPAEILGLGKTPDPSPPQPEPPPPQIQKDPAVSLFNTLQVARERQQAQLAKDIASAGEEATRRSWRQRLWSARAFLVAGLLGLVGFSAWGLWGILKKKPEPSSAMVKTIQSSEGGAAAPAAPQLPPPAEPVPRPPQETPAFSVSPPRPRIANPVPSVPDPHAALAPREPEPPPPESEPRWEEPAQAVPPPVADWRENHDGSLDPANPPPPPPEGPGLISQMAQEQGVQLGGAEGAPGAPPPNPNGQQPQPQLTILPGAPPVQEP